MSALPREPPTTHVGVTTIVDPTEGPSTTVTSATGELSRTSAEKVWYEFMVTIRAAE